MWGGLISGELLAAVQNETLDSGDSKPRKSTTQQNQTSTLLAWNTFQASETWHLPAPPTDVRVPRGNVARDRKGSANRSSHRDSLSISLAVKFYLFHILASWDFEPLSASTYITYLKEAISGKALSGARLKWHRSKTEW